MKKLLKSEFCGTLNTEEKSKHAAQEKKKRGKANTQNVNMLCIQTAPMFHQLQFVMCFFFFFSRFRCIWFILICLTFRVRWIFVSKNICSTCANNCMPSVYTFLNGVITPLFLEFLGNDTPPQTWRLCLVEWNGGKKRRERKKSGERI